MQRVLTQVRGMMFGLRQLNMRLLLLLPTVLLAGCMTFILPRPHDPVIFSDLVEFKILSTTISCEDKEKGWKESLARVNKIKIYSTYRNDPQMVNVKGLHEAMNKAYSSTNPVFCKSLLNVQQKRIDVIIDAWKDRK